MNLLSLSTHFPDEVQLSQLNSLANCFPDAKFFSLHAKLSHKDCLLQLPKSNFLKKRSDLTNYLTTLADNKPFMIVDEETLEQLLDLRLNIPFVFWTHKHLSNSSLVKKMHKQQVPMLVTSSWLEDFYQSLSPQILSPAYLPQPLPKQEKHTSFVVGAIAPLEAHQGHEALLRAVHSTREMLPQLRVILIGDGEEKRKLQWLITHLHIKASVQIVSRQDHYERFITNFDVLVAPSEEAMGWDPVIPHALSQGVPVIATKTGSHRDTIQHGETGLLYEPGNSTMLAQHLVNLYNHPEWREVYAKAGKQVIKKSFDQAFFCKQVTDFFAGLV